MKIVDPGVEIMNINTTSNLTTLIEKAGRVCYKSEDKITQGSAERFIKNIISRQHGAVLEHGVFIFEVDNDIYEAINRSIDKKLLKFINFTNTTSPIMSFNIRAIRDLFYTLMHKDKDESLLILALIYKIYTIYPEYKTMFSDILSLYPVENESLPTPIRDMKDKLDTLNSIIELKPITNWTSLSKEEQKIHGHITFKVVCDRGISHEIVRHRIASYAQESSRFCNYSKDNFGNEIAVIKPSFLTEQDEEDAITNPCNKFMIWNRAMLEAEISYFQLLEKGATPQEARSVLPTCLKTEIVITMNLEELELFFKLRCAKDAHPDMQKIANLMRVLYHTIVSEE